jgi:hypothetical protein
MVRSDQHPARTQLYFETVLEAWSFFSWLGYERPDVVEGDLAQRHGDLNLCKQLEFARQVWFAIGHFLRLGLIEGRSAMEYGGDVAIREFQSIIAINRVWLVRKSKPMQCPVEPVAASISRENPARPSPSVCRRC